MDWLRRRKDDHHTLDQYLKYQVPDVERHVYAARQKDFVLKRNLYEGYIRLRFRSPSGELYRCTIILGYFYLSVKVITKIKASFPEVEQFI